MIPSDSLQVIVKLWKSFDLEGRRVKLDSEFSKITEAHEESKASRKKLAEDTKGFQKSSPEEKLKKVSSLVKSYQEEVDRLTRRAKFSESAFTELYTLLEEIPDPLPVLTAALEVSQESSKVTEIELENQRLLKELSEYKKEIQEIQNQEITIRRLEEKNKEMEQNMQELVEKKVNEVEEKLKESHKEEYYTLQEREQELHHQVAKLRIELQQVQKAYGDAQSNLYTLQSKYDEEKAAQESQLEVILDEAEQLRASLRFFQEKDQNRDNEKNYEKSQNNQSNQNQQKIEEITEQLTQKDNEIQRLESLLVRSESLNKETLKATQQQLNESKSQLKQYETQVSQLTHELSLRPTSEDLAHLQKELNIYKAIDHRFKMEDQDVNDEAAIEKILKDKNRALESELTFLKVQLNDKEKETGTMRSELEKLRTQLQEQQDLITTLENDISKLQYESSSSSSSSSSGFSTASSLSTNHPSVSSPSLNSSFSKSDEMNDLLWNQGPKSNEESSMLQIICSQRDRFKARCTALEKEIREINRDLSNERSEMESIRLDNVKLYEKIKYLQSYQEISKTRNVLRDMESANSDPLEEKYRKLYEDNVNPFAIFNRKERDQRYKELNAAERITLNAGRFFLSGKYMRTFTLFYILSLHLLVFSSVYKLAQADVVCLTEEPLILNQN